MRYVLAVDPGGMDVGGDFSAYVLYDTKKKRVVWSNVWNSYGEPAFPWWIRIRMWLGLVTVVREQNELSKTVLQALYERANQMAQRSK